ncbi:pirin family protein [uncultured Sneathiella sp.]|jgi:redox-sensitive bicupin YhaK (pirin superfamily)|uniref:pirin family protein n=1 Tax=uncultured Sneathiella sp. TaxID=879315 RepID=UPI0030DB2EDE|tara:strand:- start:57152 stop:58024 length:873 start_codon:yes stop_codon:yes gene_type:complete
MTIERIINKRIHDLGGGFEVGRVLPFRARRMVGPFIFFDHLGPLELATGIPRELDVLPHPHIGLSTVTYLYSGQITHRDSLGFEQEIRPGEVNWMVAGSGITHSERLEYARTHGANIHGIQAWVALPTECEEITPSFHHHAGADLPEWEEAGVKGRLIAGEAEGLKSGVHVHSPLFYQHWEMDADARRSLTTAYPERAIYCARGKVEIGSTFLSAGQMAVLNEGRLADVVACQPSIVMVLGGEPLGQRYLLWNFVSSSKERLEQAKEDWKAGRMKLPDADNLEFVPFPED